MLYGWGLDYVLSMPARSFFTMLNEGRSLWSRRANRMLYEFCDIARIPTLVPQSVDNLKKMYFDASTTAAELRARDRLTRQIEEKAKQEKERLGLGPKDAASKEAQEIMLGIFATKRLMEHGI